MTTSASPRPRTSAVLQGLAGQCDLAGLLHQPQSCISVPTLNPETLNRPWKPRSGLGDSKQAKPEAVPVPTRDSPPGSRAGACWPTRSCWCSTPARCPRWPRWCPPSPRPPCKCPCASGTWSTACCGWSTATCAPIPPTFPATEQLAFHGSTWALSQCCVSIHTAPPADALDMWLGCTASGRDFFRSVTVFCTLAASQPAAAT